MDFELDHQRVKLEHVNNRPQKVKGGEMRPAADLKVQYSMPAAQAGERLFGATDALDWAWEANTEELPGTEGTKLNRVGTSIRSMTLARQFIGLALVVHSAMEGGPEVMTVENCRVEEFKVELEINRVVKLSFKVKAAGLTGNEIGELTEQWCHDEATISLFRRQAEAPISHKDAAKGKKPEPAAAAA